MSLDDLCDLHETIGAILSYKIETEKKLEQQLNQPASKLDVHLNPDFNSVIF